jgi:hypothetical protein
MNRSKTYRRGTEIKITDIPAIIEKKGAIIVKTDCGSEIYPAFELLDWHLKSLLKVRLFSTTKKSRI